MASVVGARSCGDETHLGTTMGSAFVFTLPYSPDGRNGDGKDALCAMSQVKLACPGTTGSCVPATDKAMCQSSETFSLPSTFLSSARPQPLRGAVPRCTSLSPDRLPRLVVGRRRAQRLPQRCGAG